MAITLFAIGFWVVVTLVFAHLLITASASTNFSPYIAFGVVAALVVAAGDLAVARLLFGSVYLWGNHVMWHHCIIWILPQLFTLLIIWKFFDRDEGVLKL